MCTHTVMPSLFICVIFIGINGVILGKHEESTYNITYTDSDGNLPFVFISDFYTEFRS